MRNIYQNLIDACRGDKSRLTHLHTSAAELLRSSYDALLQAPEGSQERTHQEWLQVEIKERWLKSTSFAGGHEPFSVNNDYREGLDSGV